MSKASFEVRNEECMGGMDAVCVRSVDLIVCDPPYGINTKSDGMGKLNPWADLTNAAYWYAAWMAKCRDVLREDGAMWLCLNWRSMVTFQKASCDIGWPIQSMLIWDQKYIRPGGARGLRPRYEMVALFAMPEFKIKNRSASDVLQIPFATVKQTGHPAEKPVGLMDWIIKESIGERSDGLVLDLFAGSGTVGVSAVSAGFDYIGFEIDSNWSDYAMQRIADSMRQQTLFGGVV